MPSNRQLKDNKSSLATSSPPNNETDMAEGTGNSVTISELIRLQGELRVALAEDFKATIAELDTKMEKLQVFCRYYFMKLPIEDL